MKENINKEMIQKSKIALSIDHDTAKYRTSYSIVDFQISYIINKNK